MKVEKTCEQRREEQEQFRAAAEPGGGIDHGTWLDSFLEAVPATVEKGTALQQQCNRAAGAWQRSRGSSKNPLLSLVEQVRLGAAQVDDLGAAIALRQEQALSRCKTAGQAAKQAAARSQPRASSLSESGQRLTAHHALPRPAADTCPRRSAASQPPPLNSRPSPVSCIPCSSMRPTRRCRRTQRSALRTNRSCTRHTRAPGWRAARRSRRWGTCRRLRARSEGAVGKGEGGGTT